MTPLAPTTARQSRGRGLLRRGAAILALAFLFALVLVAAGLFFGARALLRGSVPARVAEAAVASVTGERTSIESLDIRPGEGIATASGISIGDAFSAGSVRVVFEPESLAKGNAPRIDSVEIADAALDVSAETVSEIAGIVRRLTESFGGGGGGAGGARPDVRVVRATLHLGLGGRSITLHPVEGRLAPDGTARLDASGAGWTLAASTVEGGFRADASFERDAETAAVWATLLSSPEEAIPESIEASLIIVRPERHTEGGALRIDAAARATLSSHPITGASEPADVSIAIGARSGASGLVLIDRLEIAGLTEDPVVAHGEADPDGRRIDLASFEPSRWPLPAAAGASAATLVVEEWSVRAIAPGSLRARAAARIEGGSVPLADGARLEVEAVLPDLRSEGSFTFAAEAPAPRIGDEAEVPPPLLASGRGRFSPVARTLHLDASSLEWPGVATAAADGTLDFESRRVDRLRVELSDEIEVENVARALKRFEFLRPGVTLDGSVRGVADVRGLALSGESIERFSLLVVGRDVSFGGTPRDGKPIAGEGLRFSASLAAESDAPSGSTRGRLTGDVGNLTLLWGDRLVDLEGRTIAYDVPFELDVVSRALSIAGATVAGGDLGDVTADGAVRFAADGFAPVALEATASLEGVSIETLFERTILADAAARLPSLTATAFTGEIDATVRIESDGGPVSVEGEATVEGAGATGPFFALEDVAARLPVSLGPARVGPRPGRFRIGSATVRGIPIGEIDLPLLVMSDRLLLLEPASVEVFGGELEIADFRFASPTDAEIVLVLRALDAARIGYALDSPLVLAGEVFSEGPLVLRAGPGGIAIAGTVAAKILGGEVRLGGFRMDDPFGSVPRFRFDADAIDLDLAKVTAALAYGEITGNLSGEARDIVLTPFGPERFAVRFAANAAEGRPAKASVKAIREMPFLATEGRLSLQGILFDIINSFGYSRFGAITALDDGRFHVRGRYAEDGRDLYGSPESLAIPFVPSGEKAEHAFIGTGLPTLAIIVEPPKGSLSFTDFVRQVKSARQARLE